MRGSCSQTDVHTRQKDFLLGCIFFSKDSPVAGMAWMPPEELCAHLLPLAFYT